MDKDEALKMAIEWIKSVHWKPTNSAAVIKACEEALEQPAQEYLTRAQQVIRANNSAQEPVAWMKRSWIDELGWYDDFKSGAFADETDKDGWTPLYTHPAPSWQGLDAVEVSNIFISKEVNGNATQFARAIEQALKERNS